jgi:radical SAM superfamily enzyme YgiQ (UPF0313 family)
MGYLASMLLSRGHTVELVDIRDGQEQIVAHCVRAAPVVVGFSLIFQTFLPQFVELARALRAAGVGAHFTIGGHYASLCPDAVLAQMPQLDSVALFEGEHTLLELLEALERGSPWREVAGLAHPAAEAPHALVRSTPRPLEPNLDLLPPPYRPKRPATILGFNSVALIASRGCARRCSFCSIHTFYRNAPGKAVRVRSPELVVAEMTDLFDNSGVRVFLFQDDDFPLWGRAGAKWVQAFVAELHRAGLAEEVLWKISCRAEYVQPGLFAQLRDAGLFMVYMGIESGVDEGLAVLNKGITAQQSLDAVATLRDLGIMYSYGFMLLDPSSSFRSVRQNIGFLRTLVGDGSAAGLFCRMLPYAGTPIQEQLQREGRLHGDLIHPDYDFLEPGLGTYHARMDQVAGLWVHNDGVSHQLNWAWDELGVATRLVPGLKQHRQYARALAELTCASNAALFDMVESSSLAFQAGDREALDASLDWWAADELVRTTKSQLLELRNQFVYQNVEPIMSAVESGTRHTAVMAAH